MIEHPPPDPDATARAGPAVRPRRGTGALEAGSGQPGLWPTALLCAVLTALWAGLSDAVVTWLLDDPARRALAGAIKGGLFVAGMAALSYAALRWLLARQQALFDARSAARDVRDRALQLLQSVAENSPDAIFVKDRAGRYLMLNRECTRLTGRSSNELLGRDDRAIYSPQQAAPIQAHDEQVMSADQSQTFEEEVDTVDGFHTYLTTKGPLHGPAGEVIGMFGISRNVSERAAAEKRLRDSEQRHRALFEASPLPMWVLDRDGGRFLAVNEAAVAHYGYAREEFLAMTISDVEAGEPLPAGAVRTVHRCKDGRHIEVQTSANDLSFDGRPARLVLVRDESAQAELERQREVAQLAAMAASSELGDVLARVDDAFVALDLEACFTYVNPRAAKLLGRQGPHGLRGQHLWAEFPQLVETPFFQDYARAMSMQQPLLSQDYFAESKRWFEGRLYPSPSGMTIYFSDFTTRKNVEDALRVSELRYRLAAAHGQVWDWDIATGDVVFPAAFWEALGVPPPLPQDTVARFEGMLHPEDLPRWRDALRDHLARREPYELEYRIRRADGEWRWMLTQGQAVWNDAGRATYMAGTTFDVSRRRQATELLHQAEVYRHSLIEQLADSVLLLDRDYRILDANPQTSLMLGYPRERLLTLRLLDLVPDVERKLLRQDLTELMIGSAYLAEWELVRHDGSPFPVEASARALTDHRILAVVRDISTRRASEQAMMTLQFELSDLAQRLLTQEQLTTQRLAQGLHDRLGQTLAAARLNLDACVSAHSDLMPLAMQTQSRAIAGQLEQAVRELRHVLAELRPPLLEDQGLAAALDNELGLLALPEGLADVLIEAAPEAAQQRWPDNVEYGAFMIVRESIANARQHAGATLIRVLIDGDDASLGIDVIDDGDGIAPGMVGGRPGHLGIVGMRERAIAIGAQFAVERPAEGGTRVTLRWEMRPE